LRSVGEHEVVNWLAQENDPRLTEIVSHLNQVVQEAKI